MRPVFSAEVSVTKVSAAKVRTAATAGMATATAGERRLRFRNQQHADRNNRRENAAFASHKETFPMANTDNFSEENFVPDVGRVGGRLGLRDARFSAAIGGKADIACCGAYVRF
jgi:hypothetical protein